MLGVSSKFIGDLSTKDPWDVPLYTPHEAANYISLPVSTAYKWLKSEDKFLHPNSTQYLTFKHLVELYVLNVLRRKHRLSLKKIHSAVTYLRNTYSLTHPLADLHIKTDGSNVMVEELGQLINASESGQMEFKDIIAPFLSRIERGQDHQPLRLYPLTGPKNDKRAIIIDPTVNFGKPVITGTRIKTDVVYERFKAGDRIAELAKDYELEPWKIKEAIAYQKAAGAIHLSGRRIAG